MISNHTLLNWCNEIGFRNNFSVSINAAIAEKADDSKHKINKNLATTIFRKQVKIFQDVA